jgi:hypothetical protein
MQSGFKKILQILLIAVRVKSKLIVRMTEISKTGLGIACKIKA